MWTTRLADIKDNIKIFTPIVYLAIVLEMLVGISYAHVEYSANAQNTAVAFHPGVFQGIIFIHMEAMVKEVDS